MRRSKRLAEFYQSHRDDLSHFVSEPMVEKGGVTNYSIERDGDTVAAARTRHCVRKEQTTLYDIVVRSDWRGNGFASELIERIASESPHERIIAKCPAWFEATQFYSGGGWELVTVEVDGEPSPNNAVCVWRFDIDG
jgi:N-acetylglutamate synthase-like GNAT family acetyltransferase